MFTPEGYPANKLDKTMLLAMWARFLQKKSSQKMLFAGIGKPSLPLNKHTKEFLANYWLNHTGEAITYDHPQGNLDARKTMAAAMQRWYKTEISESDVLFNIGGAGALKAIFSAVLESSDSCRIVTPFPYYSLYAESSATLHPIDVMKNPGYRLTAASLKKSIDSAYQLAEVDGKYPKAFLLCDPNNPLGTVLNRNELHEIAQVLRKYPDLVIILDEAYAEMVLDGNQHTSLLSVAPDLKQRIIVMRSATKGLSAAGERMAITIAFDQSLMAKLVQYNITNCGHAPVSLQFAYAETLNRFENSDIQEIADFYRPKVEYVRKRILQMGANISDLSKIEGAFYVLADFSDLLSEPLSEKTYSALGTKGVISSDEEIAYSLLFEDFVMISPLSYFGLSQSLGIMRITCSEDLEDLKDLLNRIESRLLKARVEKNKKLHLQFEDTLLTLVEFDTDKHNSIQRKIPTFNESLSCLELKIQNDLLTGLLKEARQILFDAPEHIQSKINQQVHSRELIEAPLSKKELSINS